MFRHPARLAPAHALAAAVLGALAGAPLACGGTANNVGSGGQGGTGSGGKGSTSPSSSSTGGASSTSQSSSSSGTGGMPGTSSSSSSTSTTSSTSSSTSGNPCPVHCSGDLHQVLDCNNAVVMTCPDTQGCEPNGTCIDPCASAEANNSTIGCEFYGTPPSVITQSKGACYAALIANTWTSPISIQVEYKGAALDINGLARIPSGSGASLTYDPLPNGQLPPGKLAVLFLAQKSGSLACPAGATPGVQADPTISGTGFADSFRIKTSAPAVAYDMFPYGGAPSHVSGASLLVPTAAWGVNYIAADAYEQEPLFSGINASPFVQIVAAQDATMVTISPTAPIAAGNGVAAVPQGMPATYTLNRGQVLQFLQPQELAGTPISADKPIGVWGGSGCMNIPISKYACDSAHQQILPVKALGNEYVAVRYRDREAGANESVPWTFVGAVDGTQLTYDPAPPPGAPTTLNSGQVVRFVTPDVFSVKAQNNAHPFSVAGHMTGWTNLPSLNKGDPEYVISIPPHQYLSHYLFLTDPTYGTSHLVFVRKKAADNTFKPVTLDCLGEVTGWQPVGAAGQYEYARVDLVTDFVKQGTCDNGVHTADSAEPFGLTVWGWDFAVSYAYPAGTSAKAINAVVVAPVPK